MPIVETIIAAITKAVLGIATDKAMQAQAEKAKSLEKTLQTVGDSLQQEKDIKAAQDGTAKVELGGDIKLSDKL